jgi:hypothetical protein
MLLASLRFLFIRLKTLPHNLSWKKYTTNFIKASIDAIVPATVALPIKPNDMIKVIQTDNIRYDNDLYK